MGAEWQGMRTALLLGVLFILSVFAIVLMHSCGEDRPRFGPGDYLISEAAHPFASSSTRFTFASSSSFAPSPLRYICV